MEIKKIKLIDCKDWFLKKHYAKRVPRVQFCFGLYDNDFLCGVISYGYPATPFVSRGICGKKYEEEVLELNRLVINSDAPKNSASYLIANSMKKLPIKYKLIISYADISMNHIGKVYQATHFFYLGLSIPMKEWRLNNSNLHSQNVCKKVSLNNRKIDNNFNQILRPQKHRYLYIRGNKKDKKERLNNLKYEIQDYPKGNSDKYDCIDIKKPTLFNYTK